MYRHRNLDIVIATIIAILGALAAAKHLPGQLTIPLGFGLFFAPGYLWSEAILSQRLPGFERAMTSAGMALVFPIIGGFLFYSIHIPLFKSAWIGLLVVLTLLGVVAVAIQRLRDVPEDEQTQEQQRRNQQRPRDSGPALLHASIFGLAAVIGIGAVAYSVKSAEAQKFPGYTMLSMTGVRNSAAQQDTANLSDNQDAQNNAQLAANAEQPKATQAHLLVTNHQGVAAQYKLALLKNGKAINTWSFTLSEGQSWQQTIPYTSNTNAAKPYSLVANLYLLPDATKVFHCVDNGIKPLCKS